MIYKCYACQQDVDTSKPVAPTFALGQTPEDKLKQALKKLHDAVPCESCIAMGCHGAHHYAASQCPCGDTCHDNIERARREAQTLLNFG